MRYIKSFSIFESINTDRFSKESDESLKTLSYLLEELKSSYYEISINSVSCRDSDSFKGSAPFFNAMSKTISRHERCPYFQKFGLEPLEKIGEVITVRIYNEKEFLWDDVESIATECVAFMQSEGWRYILQPVWDITPNCSLDDMLDYKRINKFGKNQKGLMKTFCMVFYNDFTQEI